ncbi:hypothetical protein [Janthinobacterium violaceinigrum]|uniref:Uncharacterized protein n=1 Tax=Janthinobacterium violaceinigrum TaxID=2654252 RepID=A0A6I1I8E6_9BURK|nr:hypothetical protein [Janthinobacterium violaceinigrum]KAB8063697.1 hypothetical protein GCN75_16740 [Janthinobacterium violaceinigrum]
MTASPFKSYLATLALLMAAGALLAGAFVAVVDPYGLYGFVLRDGFNAVKPGLTRYQNQIKQELALRRRPQFIILGNSRAEIGFDPRASALSALGAGYNLAIPGTGLATSASQFAQLRQAGVQPRTVIVGMEFIDFLNPAAAPAARPVAATTAPAPARAFWRFDTLFSLASVKDAVHTLRIQHDAQAATLTADGFNPLLEYGAHVRRDGYHKMFAQRAQESAANLRRKSTRGLATEDFHALRAFLLAMAATQADIKLVIYPYHAQMLAMFEAAGLWPLFDEWKAGLILAMGAVKAQYPDARISLTDFSGYGVYNCERIPAANERDSATRWYWEAGHFKKALGDIVLQRLMSPTTGAPGDGQFGMPLDGASLAQNRARIAQERGACAAAQPALFATQLLATQDSHSGGRR